MSRYASLGGPACAAHLLVFSLCGFSGDAPLVGAPERARREVNILILSVDTLRADRLGCYGYDEWGPRPRRTSMRSRWATRVSAPQELRRIRGLYDGAVAATDARIGRLLDKLDRLGVTDRTYVVITADHGEELYDRNRYFYHGNSIYDGVLRVPLIVAGPDVPAGVRLGGPVQNVDLTATIYEWAGLGVPDDCEAR